MDIFWTSHQQNCTTKVFVVLNLTATQEVGAPICCCQHMIHQLGTSGRHAPKPILRPISGYALIENCGASYSCEVRLMDNGFAPLSSFSTVYSAFLFYVLTGLSPLFELLRGSARL